MSRPRTIDRDSVLDAAEAVVVRDGAARLTLDAVATEAGISKATVLYDYKSKEALIRAVSERRLGEERAKMNAAVLARQGEANALIKAFIATIGQGMDCRAQSVGINLCAAASLDAELRHGWEKLVGSTMTEIQETSTDPAKAQIAFLAVQGLKLMEFLGLYDWPPEERARILGDIAAMIDDPAPTGTSAKELPALQ